MNISHEFDVYHLANTIRKNLKVKTSKKKFAALKKWERSIINHLWWSAATCQGNPDILVEKWVSITEHVTDQHEFERNKYFKACDHSIMERLLERESEEPAAKRARGEGTEQKCKQWLKKDSNAHRALCSVVLNSRLLKDIRMLANFCHTGALEAFHSLLLKYAPKRTEFDYNSMECRLQLAALDHNYNVNRKQATIKQPRKGSGAVGDARYRTRFSKATQQWIVEPVLESKSYKFAENLLVDVMQLKATGENLVKKQQPTHIPKNIAKKERPDKGELLQKHKSRMGKTP